MSIKPIGNILDIENFEKINENFRYLASQESRIIKDILSKDPSRLDASENGVSKNVNVIINSSADYGVNFRSEVNGIIAYAWVYSPNSKRLGLGMVEQIVGDVGGSQIVYNIHTLKSGWNKVYINAPIEQGMSYTLFKRNVGQGLDTGSVRIRPWSGYDFLGGQLDFNGGMFIHESGTHAQYSSFFSIGVVTNLAQIYSLMNSSVKPVNQFYVGDNPPPEAKFWFKPIGG